MLAYVYLNNTVITHLSFGTSCMFGGLKPPTTSLLAMSLTMCYKIVHIMYTCIATLHTIQLHYYAPAPNRWGH